MAVLFTPDAPSMDVVRGFDPAFRVVETEESLLAALQSTPDEELVVFGSEADAHVAFRLASALRVQRPAVGVILVRKRVDSATLNHALRAGVREVVRLESTDVLADACQRVLDLAAQVTTRVSAAGHPSPVGPAKVVTVFSAKGGCGKTTIATNLGASIASTEDKKVCLVDLDLPFGDVAISLQLTAEHTLADSIPMVGHMDEMGVRSIVTRHRSGLDALVAPFGPGEAERISPALITDLLEQLRPLYDVVIIDTPPAFTEQVLAALDATDVFLLVATLDVPAIKNLKLTLEMLEMLGYSADRQHVVLNRSDAKVGLTVEDVSKVLRRPIQAEIPSSRDVPASLNRGAPLCLDQPRHPVSLAIKRLHDLVEVQSASLEAEPRHAKRRSLLKRGGTAA